MKYKLKNIVFSGNENSNLRPNMICANLVDSDNNLVISAILEHILITIKDNDLDVENVTKSYSDRNGTEITLNLYN